MKKLPLFLVIFFLLDFCNALLSKIINKTYSHLIFTLFKEGSSCQRVIEPLKLQFLELCTNKTTISSTLCVVELIENQMEAEDHFTFIRMPNQINHNTGITSQLILDIELDERYNLLDISIEIWAEVSNRNTEEIQNLPILEIIHESIEGQFSSGYEFQEIRQKQIGQSFWKMFSFQGSLKGPRSYVSLRITSRNNHLLIKSFDVKQDESTDSLQLGCDTTLSIKCNQQNQNFEPVIQQCVMANQICSGANPFESTILHSCVQHCQAGEYIYLLKSNYPLCMQGYQICDQSELFGCRACNRLGSICFECQEGFSLENHKCYQSSTTSLAPRILATNNCQRPQCLQCLNGTICLSCASPFANVHGACTLCGRGAHLVASAFDSYCIKTTGQKSCSNYDPTNSVCNGCFYGSQLSTGCDQTPTCSSSLTYITSTLTCGTCSTNVSNCLQCASSKQCLKCATGYALAIEDYTADNPNVICLLACPAGFYKDSTGFCAPCGVNCDTCLNSSVTCVTCKLTYVVDTAYSSSYPSARQRCIPALVCPQNCSSCSSSSVCTTCMSGYAAVSGACEKCGTGCKTCTSSTNCTECMDGTATPTCTALTCSQGYYVGESFTCVSCSSNCLSCWNASSCDICMPGYVVEGGHCLACPSNCKVCQDANKCLSCNSGYKVSGNVCVVNSNTCSSGQYHNGTTCVACHSGCATCSEGTYCLTCTNTKIPEKGVCSTCTSTQYVNSSFACENCPSNCSNCVNTLGCTACNSGYYYDSSQPISPCLPLSVCGDGDMTNPILSGGVVISKQCDDRNTTNGDGCNSSCQIESSYVCTYNSGTSTSTCTRYSVCGDGDVAHPQLVSGSLQSKQCDDQNTTSGDGCSSTCQIESSYVCPYNSSLSKSECTRYSVCGDGDMAHQQLVSGSLQSKQCDDKNTTSGDGCSSTCQIESSYVCPYNNTLLKSECTRYSVCGDGDIVHKQIRSGTLQTKQCDDTNTTSGDGCSSDCQIESSYVCPYDSTNLKSVCTRYSVCGDGDMAHQQLVSGSLQSKQCDDQNTTSGDGCSSTCQIESSYICPYNSSLSKSECTRYSVCGDGDMAHQQLVSGSLQSKQCDDKNTTSGDGCSSTCQIESSYVCSYNSTLSKSQCTRYSVCGDGDIVHKQIRSGSLQTKQCDDANTTSGDGCSSDCQLESMYTCPYNSSLSKSVCTRYSVCGDGDMAHPQIRSGNLEAKQCDDQNTTSGDGCSSQCQTEAHYSCTYNSSLSKSECTRYSVCGDGDITNPQIVGGSFQAKGCDDKNTGNGDGCSSTCAVESGYYCSYDSSQGKSLCSPFSVCGDGNVAVPMDISGTTVFKGCDDKNAVNGDGCDTSCNVESGYICFYNNSTLQSDCSHFSVCGDGNVAIPMQVGTATVYKQCDDTNTTDGDGCNSSCSVEAGYLCPYSSADGKSICTRYSVCGDGDMVTPQNLNGSLSNKECDDNNAVSGDGCSSNCLIESGYSCTYSSSDFKSTCKRDVLPNSFELKTKMSANSLNSIVIVNFKNPLLHARRFLASSDGLHNYISDSMSVEVSDTPATGYSYTTTVHDDDSGFDIEFTASQNIVSKVAKITFGNDFLTKNNMSSSSATIDLPDMKPISESEKVAAEAVASVGEVAAAGFIASVIPVIIFSNFSLLFNALDLFQMIFYLQYIYVRFPYNVVEFLKIMANLQVPFSLNFIQWLVSDDLNDNSETPKPYSKAEVSGAFLDNTGDSISQIIIVVSSHLLLILIKNLCKKSSKSLILKSGNFLEKKLITSWKWGWYLDMYWEMYLSLIVACTLQFYGFGTENISSIFNIILFTVFLIIILATPIVFAWIISRNSKNLEEEEIKYKWGMLYETLKLKNNSKILPIILSSKPTTAKGSVEEINSYSTIIFDKKGEDYENKLKAKPVLSQFSKKQSGSLNNLENQVADTHKDNSLQTLKDRLCKYFFICLYIRKLLFGILIVVLWEYQFAQLVCIDLLNGLIIAFILIVKPYESVSHNYKNLACEILMLISQFSIKFLIDDPADEDESFRMNIGWIFITCCVGILFIQLVFIFYNLIVDANKEIRIFLNNCKKSTNVSVKRKSSIELQQGDDSPEDTQEVKRNNSLSQVATNQTALKQKKDDFNISNSIRGLMANRLVVRGQSKDTVSRQDKDEVITNNDSFIGQNSSQNIQLPGSNKQSIRKKVKMSLNYPATDLINF